MIEYVIIFFNSSFFVCIYKLLQYSISSFFKGIYLLKGIKKDTLNESSSTTPCINLVTLLPSFFLSSIFLLLLAKSNRDLLFDLNKVLLLLKLPSCKIKLKESDNEVPVEGITPEELTRRMDNNDPMTIIDVREPHERAIMRFPNAIVIPIGQLARRMKELDPGIDTVFICKEGKRSILAINTLREAGYEGKMYNLKGGIDAMKDIVFSHEGAWL